jgi:hypothetical protein
MLSKSLRKGTVELEYENGRWPRVEPQIQENSLRGRHAGRLKKKDDAPFRLRASLM